MRGPSNIHITDSHLVDVTLSWVLPKFPDYRGPKLISYSACYVGSSSLATSPTSQMPSRFDSSFPDCSTTEDVPSIVSEGNGGYYTLTLDFQTLFGGLAVSMDLKAYCHRSSDASLLFSDSERLSTAPTRGPGPSSVHVHARRHHT